MTSTLHQRPPFRAEHLGSLLRPEALLNKRLAVYRGQAKEQDFKNLEDQVVTDIVKTQLELGFKAISDGEYRRRIFWGTFFPSLNGMKEIHNPPMEMFRTYLPDIAAFVESRENPAESVVCESKISHTGKSTMVDQWEFIKSLVPKEQWGDIKLTMPAPEWYHLRYKEGKAYPKDVYANAAEYFADIAKAYQDELEILHKAGVRNVQIDDPNFAYFCAESMLDGWKKDSSNASTTDELLDAYIKLYNDCLSRHLQDMHVGLHICRGNFVGSRHFSEGGYDKIATKLFQELNVHTFYLEYDTPRAGGFEPLEYLPKNKNVILGVITSKFPKMEDKEEMKKRIYDAADMIAEGNKETREEALKRVGVSPQCGFASHEGGNSLGHQDMINKLKLVRQIADEVWPGEP